LWRNGGWHPDAAYEQYLRLRDALPGHLKPLLVVGYYVGNRIGELR
jgi:hypothetical protein